MQTFVHRGVMRGTVSLVLTLMLLAGCVTPEVRPADGNVSAEPTRDDGTNPRHAIEFVWVNQERDRTNDIQLKNAVSLTMNETHGSLYAESDWGDEGNDFSMRIEVRRGSAGNLRWDPDLATPDTYRFDYFESVFWGGHQVCEVVTVDGDSQLVVTAWSSEHEAFMGTFEITFEGNCQGSKTKTVELVSGTFR